jgi:hypothetical protein
MAWGVSRSGASYSFLSTSLLKEIFKSLGVFAEGAAETADEFRSDRLQHQTVFLFDEGHLGTLFDGVLTAKFCGDDELAFGGDGGDFGFHGGSCEQDWRQVY